MTNEQLALIRFPLDVPLRMAAKFCLCVGIALSLLLSDSLVEAATPIPRSLAEVKHASGAVVLGRVLNLEVEVWGTQPNSGSGGRDIPPSVGASGDELNSYSLSNSEQVDTTANSGTQGFINTVRPSGGASAVTDSATLNTLANDTTTAGSFTTGTMTAVTATVATSTVGTLVGLATEGGRMSFTTVKFSVEEVLGDLNESTLDPTLIYSFAGGETEGFGARVFGIPEVEVGRRYILFLHEDLTRRGNPYVGLGQGVFPVVLDPVTGRNIVTDVNGNPVIGVEKGRVVVRASDERRMELKARVNLQPLPRDDSATVTSNVGQSRFWSSDESALSPSDFMKLVADL